jgi:hypothetical protein
VAILDPSALADTLITPRGCAPETDHIRLKFSFLFFADSSSTYFSSQHFRLSSEPADKRYPSSTGKKWTEKAASSETLVLERGTKGNEDIFIELID